MHRRISETSSSARSASAHAVQLRAQSKHSAMQRASASRSTSLGFGWVASSSATLVAVAMTPPPSGLPARTADGPSYPACSCSTKTEAPRSRWVAGRSCCASRSTAAPASSQTPRCATSTSPLAATSPPTARGRATHWGGDQVTPFQGNVPVVVSGVGVMPGNYVLADSSGAVVIPDQQLDEVLAGARRIAAEDERYRAEIAREDLSRSSEGRGAER
jgi:hypothetical protein